MKGNMKRDIAKLCPDLLIFNMSIPSRPSVRTVKI